MIRSDLTKQQTILIIDAMIERRDRLMKELFEFGEWETEYDQFCDMLDAAKAAHDVISDAQYANSISFYDLLRSHASAIGRFEFVNTMFIAAEHFNEEMNPLWEAHVAA